MAKINPNLLPAPAGLRIEKVSAPVPGQGEFVLYLRQPTFSELLKLQEDVRLATEKWEKTGDWYPCVPPVQPSDSLWQVILPALAWQCQENGEDLLPGDRYSEQELVPIVGRVPAVFAALAGVITRLNTVAGDDLGNGSTEGAVSPSGPAPSTTNPTLT